MHQSYALVPWLINLEMEKRDRQTPNPKGKRDRETNEKNYQNKEKKSNKE